MEPVKALHTQPPADLFIPAGVFRMKWAKKVLAQSMCLITVLSAELWTIILVIVHYALRGKAIYMINNSGFNELIFIRR